MANTSHESDNTTESSERTLKSGNYETALLDQADPRANGGWTEIPVQGKAPPAPAAKTAEEDPFARIFLSDMTGSAFPGESEGRRPARHTMPARIKTAVMDFLRGLTG